MSADDRALYEHWAEGDRSCGEQLVRRNLAAVARFFGNKVARIEDRPDLVARTFEIVARKLGDYRGQSTFRAYVLGIARNVLREYLRALRRLPASDPLEESSLVELTRSPSVRVAEAEERQLLLVALRSIPLQAQIVLELSLFEELGRAEIAQVLDVPVGTVASRIRRGRAELERRLEALASGEAQLAATLDSLTAWRTRIRAELDEAG